VGSVNRPVMIGYDDSASPGRLRLDDLVKGFETLAVVCGAELVGEVVGTDGTEVDCRIGRKDVLTRARLFSLTVPESY
jgi:hypothetical protein